MPFGYYKYRICRTCGYLGALSNHGKNAGKVAGHQHQECPKENILFSDLPKATKAQIQQHLHKNKGSK